MSASRPVRTRAAGITRALTAFALTTLAVASCKDEVPADPGFDPALADSVATVTLSPANPTVGVGATFELHALLADSSGATVVGPGVEWQTSSSQIARVEEAGEIIGIVTGVTVGTVTITATLSASSGDKTGTTIVSVVPSVVANVAVSPSTLSLAVGRSEQLTVIVMDAQGNTLAGRVIQWRSTSGAAIVDDFGRVTAVFQGTATITASCEGVEGSSYVVITP